MGGGVVAGYAGLVTGAISVDLRVGRRSRPHGPLSVGVDAPRELVFDVIAEPYLGRQTRAVAEKIKVLERGADMVLAAHMTPVHPHLVARTVETVRFTRPERVDSGWSAVRCPTWWSGSRSQPPMPGRAWSIRVSWRPTWGRLAGGGAIWLLAAGSGWLPTRSPRSRPRPSAAGL
jgi:hypothetical protein